MMRGGSRFRAQGAASPATNNCWFGSPIADRFNVLYPTRLSYQVQSFTPANHVNLWHIDNPGADRGGTPNAAMVSLGAMATAPDGTNTAQKIVETATTGRHRLIAGFTTFIVGPYDMRLAVFAKAAERTRLVLYMGSATAIDTGSPWWPPTPTCSTVFNLANGTIAVPGTSVGFEYYDPPGPWVPLGDHIIPFGNGWYLCMMDVRCTDFMLDPNIQCQVRIDNGSGTAALSDNYAGDGTSGLYTWRSTLLPISAWAMKGVPEFFDDFDSTDTFDLNNTRNPGYNWYLWNRWPWFPMLNVMSPSHLDVSNSILHIYQSDQANLSLGTAAWLGNWNENPPPNGTYSGPIDQWTGRMFYGPPGLFEVRCRWESNTLDHQGTTAFWMVNERGLLVIRPGSTGVPIFEYDFIEMPPGPGQQIEPASSVILSTDIPYVGFGVPKLADVAGNSEWLSNMQYHGEGYNEYVYYGNTLYRSMAVSQGAQPDINPSKWRVSADEHGGEIPLPANPTNYPKVDFSQFHTYSTLWLPFSKQDNWRAGHFLQFFDDKYVRSAYGRGHYSYHPTSRTVSLGNVLHQLDADRFPILLAGGQNYHTWFDWVKITR